MSSQPRIPDAETRARSVANLRALVKRMDAGILQLDELIASLEADIRNSPLTAYRLGKAKRKIAPEESSQ
jgi:exonuclease VII small subunit